MIKNILLNYMYLLYISIRQKNTIPILNYHNVLPAIDPLKPDAITSYSFNNICSFLSHKFKVITLKEAISQAISRRLPKNAIVITFDDGYRNNYTIAYPILYKYNLPATFFLTTGFLNNRFMWNDGIFHAIKNTYHKELDLRKIKLGRYPINSIAEKRNTINRLINFLKYIPNKERLETVTKILEFASVEEPQDLMMNECHIINLHQSKMEIGGHTVSHPILTKVSLSEASSEIIENKNLLEHILGERLSSFAYPNGRLKKDFTEDHAKIVKDAGYRFAVTTEQELFNETFDLFQIPRYTPWRKEPFGFISQLVLQALKSRRKKN